MAVSGDLRRKRTVEKLARGGKMHGSSIPQGLEIVDIPGVNYYKVKPMPTALIWIIGDVTMRERGARPFE